MKKNYTVETRINLNEEIKEYLDSYAIYYNIIYRGVWKDMTDKDFKNKYEKSSYYVTHLCNKYNILKRTANTVVYDVKGRINALKELKKLELKNIESKIFMRELEINKLKDDINKMKLKATENKLNEQQLEKYRNSKKKLYYRCLKLNKLKQQRDNLSKDIKNNILRICFGTNDLFSKQHRLKENGFKTHTKWRNAFTKSKDKNIYYLGSKDEKQGNQMCQLYYNKEKDNFSLQLRKELYFEENGKHLFIDNLNFKYQKEHLKAMLDDCLHPISYRFRRVKNKWYLQVIITIEYGDKDYNTTSFYGTIGLDYNNGFIELSEIDKAGNLIYQKHYDLSHHGTGNKAKNEIREVVSRIVKHCKEVGKNLVIEDLDFKTLKSKQLKSLTSRGKKYNKMLHLFDYSRYKETIENSCFRARVELIKINPAYTSIIGEKKFSNRMKLNRHQAASYVIARRGKGIVYLI